MVVNICMCSSCTSKADEVNRKNVRKKTKVKKTARNERNEGRSVSCGIPTLDTVQTTARNAFSFSSTVSIAIV